MYQNEPCTMWTMYQNEPWTGVYRELDRGLNWTILPSGPLIEVDH